MNDAIVELSLRIDKASYDKGTDERRWSATTSDTDKDHYDTQMSIDLYKSFLRRIDGGEKPPEKFTSEAWDGGMPYLSIAHYSDLNGKGIAGDTVKVYIDGNRLKAKGLCRNTKLGHAAFRAMCDDLYTEQGKAREDKVRISIAFLDYKHAHGNFIFERKSLAERCPMCAEGIGEKVYLDGHLIHFAMTRVPVNPRTDIVPDVEMRAMAITQEQDAASIIGEELAEELNAEASAEVRSEALVERSEEETVAEAETVEEVVQEASEPEVAGVEMESEVAPTFEAQVLEALNQLLAMNGKKKMEECDEDMSEEECEKMMEKKKMKKEMKSHVLETAFNTLRSEFDRISALELSEAEKLQQLQQPFALIGETIRAELTPKHEEVSVEQSQADDLISIVQRTIQPIADKLALIETKLDARPATQTVQQPVPPQRRSYTPSLVIQRAEQTTGKPNSFEELAKRSVGLNGY